MVKKGDTLIEVTLAIGIFSMIAVAITAVLSSSTAGAQTALEATLAREEIDTQAEALRFVHTAYINNRNETAKNIYATTWKKITENAISLPGDKEAASSITKYTPTSCSEDYGDKDWVKKAFVIDPRTFDIKSNLKENSGLVEAQTYPRLIYEKGGKLQQAEGIYVIAVKDGGTTELVEGKSNEPAFYDFYIRSCWYGINSDSPSTISTLIRLYNPDAVEIFRPEIVIEMHFLNKSYKYDVDKCGEFPPQKIGYGKTLKFPEANCFSLRNKEGDLIEGINLLGWSKDSSSNNPEYKPGKIYTIKENRDLNLFPIWGNTELSFWVDLNTFIDEKDSNTSGREGFNADIIINGEKVKSDVIDFYEEVKLGANVEIVLKGVNGYRLNNSGDLCSEVKGCKIRFENGNYIITFGVTQESISKIINSSGVNAINIEPIWVRE